MSNINAIFVQNNEHCLEMATKKANWLLKIRQSTWTNWKKLLIPAKLHT